MRQPLRFVPFFAVWLLGAALIIRTVLIQPPPGPPEVHRLPPDTWTWALTAVGIMLAETAGLAVLLLRRDQYRSPARWAIAFAAMLALTLFFGFQAMHASNAMFLHVMWLALVDVLLLAGALITAVVGAARRPRSPDRPA